VGEFREVCAMLETFVKQRPLPGTGGRRGKVTVDDAVAVIGRFRNGTLATLEVTRFAHGRKNGLTIDLWWPPGHLVGYEHSFVHTIADFVSAAVAGKSAPPTFVDGLANQRVLAAIQESARRKAWVRL
jgi:predicted dehydrogenase